MAKLPTNADIREDIGELREEFAVQREEQSKMKDWVKATHDLAVKTNGRVTELEKQAIAQNAVTAYKERLSSNKQWALIVLVTIGAPLVGVIAAKVIG